MPKFNNNAKRITEIIAFFLVSSGFIGFLDAAATKPVVEELGLAIYFLQ